jgi:hypothetical protein
LQTSDLPVIGNDIPILKKCCLYYFFPGVLSGLILQLFYKTGIPFNPFLTLQHISPSFYQPCCLAELSKSQTEASQDVDLMLAQFNYFPAWAKLPQYEQQSLHHLSSSTEKKEFLLFAKSQLNLGNTLFLNFAANLTGLTPTGSIHIYVSKIYCFLYTIGFLQGC